MTTNTIETSIALLPGEAAPLEYIDGRGPITAQEALGVARRVARKEIASGRRNTKMTVPDALPEVGENKTSHIFRLPPLDVAFARARAEMEGVSLTAVVEAAIRAYGQGSPTRSE